MVCCIVMVTATASSAITTASLQRESSRLNICPDNEAKDRLNETIMSPMSSVLSCGCVRYNTQIIVLKFMLNIFWIALKRGPTVI